MLSSAIPTSMIEEIDSESYVDVLLETMGVTSLKVSDEDKAILETISEQKKLRLKLSIAALKETCQLNEATLSIAINRVKSKKIRAEESTYTQLANSFQLSCGISFFMGKNIGSGGESRVYAGHAESSCSQTPAYSVKQFNSRHDITLEMNKACAHRETKYAQYLGRKSGWFVVKDIVIAVSTWQDGDTMDSDKSISNKQAFSRLAGYFKDLNSLHLQGSIHGDLKSLNTITEGDDASLIDFSGARKIYSKKSTFPFTVKLIDPNMGVPITYPCDMYLSQYVVADNFTELFKTEDVMKTQYFTGKNHERLSCKANKSVVSVNDSENKTVVDKAAIALWKALSEETGSNRCTSEQAYEFCSQIAAAIDLNDELNPDTFENILNSTLNRNHFTVEDALRGSKRPEKFVKPSSDENDERSVRGKSGFAQNGLFNQTAAKKRKTDDAEEIQKMDLNP